MSVAIMDMMMTLTLMPLQLLLPTTMMMMMMMMNKKVTIIIMPPIMMRCLFLEMAQCDDDDAR